MIPKFPVPNKKKIKAPKISYLNNFAHKPPNPLQNTLQMEYLDLPATLKEVEDFAGVITLTDLLARILPQEKKLTISEDEPFQTFVSEIIIIVEQNSKKIVYFEPFIKKIEGLLGPQDMNIHDTITKYFHDWPDTYVQKKGLEYGEAKSFNVPLRLLISENFEKLLGLLGNVAFQCLLAETV